MAPADHKHHGQHGTMRFAWKRATGAVPCCGRCLCCQASLHDPRRNRLHLLQKALQRQHLLPCFGLKPLLIVHTQSGKLQIQPQHLAVRFPSHSISQFHALHGDQQRVERPIFHMLGDAVQVHLAPYQVPSVHQASTGSRFLRGTQHLGTKSRALKAFCRAVNNLELPLSPLNSTSHMNSETTRQGDHLAALVGHPRRARGNWFIMLGSRGSRH
jgi:hypothetical protein